MDMSASDSDDAAAAAASASPRGGRRGGGSRVKSSARVEESSDEGEEEGNKKKGKGGDNPYPVEGIYKDEAERRRVAGLTELEREDFIATRKEEILEAENRRTIAEMASRSSGKKKAAARDDDQDEEDEDEDEVYTARGTRSRKTTGASKTRSDGFEKLKKSRTEKGKKKAKKDDSDDEYEEGGSKSRRKSSGSDDESGSDMEESDEDERGAKKKGKSKKPPAAVVELADLLQLQVTRTKLAEMCRAPWFEEWIKGAFVRYSLGQDQRTGQVRYSVCQVVGIEPAERPYRFEGVQTDIWLRLKHGKAERLFGMEAVSNSPIDMHEWVRWTSQCAVDKVPATTPVQAKKIKESLAKRTSYTLTEEDLAAELAKKNKQPGGAAARVRLKMQRDHAMQNGDVEKAAELSAQLAVLEGPAADEADRTKRINDRNRAANREEVKRAEARSQEERRKISEALQRGDTSVKVDPSARVKTMPRLNYDSRPQTPTPGTPGSGTQTPLNGASASSNLAGTPMNGSARARGNKIESVVASRVQLDLDLDF
ncbi:RNA polymerase-associated protein RTF1 [Rhodotorula toruloides]|uniref:RNA polymerase-associated protein RTF1 n=1 Tax=Rhodotorula toruloides TaxID=5286 RepID=A0A511KAY2_RHOTO|nr:RNA polymerase-associated protein RTF1 [Rhodotorula toruloides]